MDFTPYGFILLATHYTSEGEYDKAAVAAGGGALGWWARKTPADEVVENTARKLDNVAPGTFNILPKAKNAAPKGPLGRGSTANLSKGTTLPRNLREQLAIEEVISNPQAGSQLRIRMTDPRWPGADGWVKMQKFVESGGREGRINVHYVLNTITGEIDDFKIVLPGTR